MNRLAQVAVLALLYAATCSAQQMEPSESANPKIEAQPGANAPAAAAPQLVMDSRHGRNDADARQCLELTGNQQIHRCAEKYRPHTAALKIAKAKVTASAESKPAAPQLALKVASDVKTPIATKADGAQVPPNALAPTNAAAKRATAPSSSAASK